jgi:hypothetical protein
MKRPAIHTAAAVALACLGAPRAMAQPTGDDDQAAKKQAAAPGDALPEKQDLSGHDLGTQKRENEFERDRFFVDKTDSNVTEKGTLVQGSLTSTSFIYHESATGNLAVPATSTAKEAAVPGASPYTRLYTDLRLQTDFRHIGGGQWDARVDVRGRLVDEPGVANAGFVAATTPESQSGLLGKNEADLKELWLVRNGVRSDLFFGRQYIPDLGAVKIDGLRVDYAASPKFTLLGFGGLYPLRGSRSIDTDYVIKDTVLVADPKNAGAFLSKTDSRFVGAASGGFGGAYRTLDSYGSLGGVVIAPLSSVPAQEDPRVFLTSNGYWRFGPQLDLYHLAIVDVVGSNAVNAGLTNLSLGLNYKPDQRLRATLSFNRVDTETLNIQAQAFLQNPDPGATFVQNESYLQRIATNEGRASLSAGLGQLQRFELTAAVSYRYRGDVTLSAPPPATGTATTVALPAAQSVEVYGSITDRRSIGDFRLGLDGSRIFGVGSSTYQRTEATTVRLSIAREFGHGEWDLEAAYNTTKDDSAGTACDGQLLNCFGAAKSSIVSGGGNLYYRFTRDWFAMASGFLNYTAIRHVDTTTSADDPPITGVTGFFRIAYRF